MYQLQIAENLIRLRREKNITQEALADHIGVTKGSVSKWEKNISKPDIGTLPLLATFFDVSIDELLGYAPQLSDDQIQKLYRQFSNDFSRYDFETVEQTVNACVKKYYSCYPFLFRMAFLWLNHYPLAKSQDKQREILESILALCDRIEDGSTDARLCSDTRILRAMVQLSLGMYPEAIEILEEASWPLNLLHTSPDLMITAYQTSGNMEKADSFAQITMYRTILSLCSAAGKFLAIHTKDPAAFGETVKRTEAVIDAWNLLSLNPNAVCVFEYQAALGYLAQDDLAAALTHIRNYLAAIKELLSKEQPLLRSDAYFTKLDQWFALAASDTSPRDRSVFIRDIEHSFDLPLFEKLESSEEFRILKKKLKEKIE